MQQTRLLGFAPAAGADALYAAMRAVSGPKLHIQRSPGIVALFQDEPAPSPFGRSRTAMIASLHCVQRRLEVGCSAGPFLPMDPAAARCPASALARVLETARERLAEALARHGATQQWDIVLRWVPEAVVAAHRAELAPVAAHGPAALADAVSGVLRAESHRREAALLAALAPAVLAFAEGGAACADSEVAVTVLLAAGADAAVEAALDGLPAEHVEGATLDMRGPMPPVSFFAVRLATAEEDAVARAWSLLQLPDRIDLATLHRHWRQGAAAVHPDRLLASAGSSGEMTVSDLTVAYRLLRDLLPQRSDGNRYTLKNLLKHAGPRLVTPVDAASPAPCPELTPEPVAEPVAEPVLAALS
jgi:hypothetical protein